MEEHRRNLKSPSQAQTSTNWRIKENTPRSRPRPSRDRQDARHDRNNSQEPSETPVAVTRLYVGNLLYTIQREQVESLFTENGFQISGMTMSIDPFTGRNPSYAFVDFGTAEEAARAMETLNGADLLGRPLRIKPNVERAKGQGAFQSRIMKYDQGREKREFRQG